jgi:hypothetical protein
MSDWEELEKELAGLTPRTPSKDFSKRVEDALGEAGSVAMRHIHDSDPSSSVACTASSIHFWIPLGLAALLVFSLYLFNPFPSELEDESSSITFLPEPSSVVDDEDSPLHGVTSEQLEDLSGVPVDGWLDPSTQERLIRRIDEGIVSRATGLPARQYRYHFIDETLWTHPASETRILSTTPRQEVYLIDLELY